jgi:2-C-methyl-D-erythritol 2,4-cyclodiphosphate synthase
LDQVVALMQDRHYQLNNLDATILCQSPKLNPYISEMRATLANHLQCDCATINIKATTGESLGFIGRKEGVCVHCVVLLTQD